jgi:hypothetical protein
LCERRKSFTQNNFSNAKAFRSRPAARSNSISTRHPFVASHAYAVRCPTLKTSPTFVVFRIESSSRYLELVNSHGYLDYRTSRGSSSRTDRLSDHSSTDGARSIIS